MNNAEFSMGSQQVHQDFQMMDNVISWPHGSVAVDHRGGDG